MPRASTLDLGPYWQPTPTGIATSPTQATPATQGNVPMLSLRWVVVLIPVLGGRPPVSLDHATSSARRAYRGPLHWSYHALRSRNAVSRRRISRPDISVTSLRKFQSSID
jgi:hypothetical protein